MNSQSKRIMGMALLAGMISGVAWAGVKYQNEKGHYVKIGGRIQLQYHLTDPDEGETTDDLLFRRLRPYIEGSVHEDWKGKFQVDFGKGDVAVKDAYMKYSGWDALDVVIGNANFCFSRELLTSSKHQQLVERTFVGDHNYGTPDRQAGIHLTGELMPDLLVWNLGVAKAAIDPDNRKLDFDTVIQFDAGDDWIQGNLAGGRLELFPNGVFKPSQGDFDGELKTALALGAFTWENDDDLINMDEDEETGATSISGSDVERVTGFEVSAALRVAGFSVDAQYNLFDSELVNGQAGVDGIYKDGETTLHNAAVEGGYMVVPEKVELVAGYQMQDADGYDKTWNRVSVGANYFVKGQDIKYQATYRMGENKDGVDGKDVNELFIQAQYVF